MAMAHPSEPARWYSVRCVFQATDRPAYEERTTLWQTDSIDAAIRMAEEEAADYEQGSGFRYVGLAQAYDLKAESVANGSEVFSLIRSSTLQPSDYIDRFFDTGAEMQRDSGDD
jgi:hypothetical protein